MHDPCEAPFLYKGPACRQSGLHLLTLAGATLHVPKQADARSARLALREAVAERFEDWGWHVLRHPGGGRSCAFADGAPCPPVSISYSGHVALILVSSDWRPVGIDIEIMSIKRARRFAIRLGELGFGDLDADEALTAFVRAEAWAKADGSGFRFGPCAALWRLRRSRRSGPRPDCRRIIDLVARPALHQDSEHVLTNAYLKIALCQDINAGLPSLFVTPRDSALHPISLGFVAN